ncbi:BadF/BadG/BcrA/BcrD ATPase family protein [Thalassotalea sp. G2M2-11]|uniref:BadF/BadG/BcrA/BcrD ATPase family protein n=1 Tax=Thalassotalea sp. G2M2-11 TaxID=2787627 RepID=UPI0019CF71A8|nr:BadF/BadG/BcrA/BcrD ATPase family protein [Thalassotalea sp. G2M2-11]
MQKNPLYLGIDGGGTKCKVQLEDVAGNVLAVGLGGPANVVRSLRDTQTAIINATIQAIEQANLSQQDFHRIIAVAGVAGANVLQSKTALENWRHPFAQLHVTTDMHIACVGAHHQQSGGVMIVGTGFCAAIKTGDQIKEFGGYGLYLGDHASGAALGLNAIQQCFQVLDGVLPATQLSNALLKQLRCHSNEQLLSKVLTAQPSFYAQFAPLVFSYAQQGDDMALAIVKKATDYIQLYAKHLLTLSPQRLCLLGGITNAIRPWLDNTLSSQLCQPKSTPEAGAIILARQLNSSG